MTSYESCPHFKSFCIPYTPYYFFSPLLVFGNCILLLKLFVCEFIFQFTSITIQFSCL